MSNDICLNFANTVRWHASPQPEETLHSYVDLLGWARQAGSITTLTAHALAEQATQRPAEARAVLVRAIALREALYRIFLASIQQQPAPVADMAVLNSELARTLAHARIAPAGQAYLWTWANDSDQLDAMLWPITRSAGELLTAPALLERVGQCADDRGCGWLFLDLSKNHSRRWCDINDCGNRAKQRRHYRRTRSLAENEEAPS